MAHSQSIKIHKTLIRFRLQVKDKQKKLKIKIQDTLCYCNFLDLLLKLYTLIRVLIIF